MACSVVADSGSAPAIETRALATRLGLGAVCGIIYFSVSGGPYGLEDTIGGAGAGLGLLLIILTPFIWSLPTALMVAELGTMMPVQGGYYHWCKTSMGPFWGFQVAWWMWVVSWVDLALYPVLFTDYAANFFPVLNADTGNGWVRYGVGFVMIWAFAMLNMRGAKLIGDSSKLFGFIVVAPFVLVTIFGLFKMDRNPFDPFVAEGLSFGPAAGAGLFVVMWNYMGWDSLSTIAGEIDQPRKNFPKALAITIPLITIIYLLPTLVSLAVVGPDEVVWTAGAYTAVAEKVGGHWLGVVVNITALVSAIGLFAAWLMSNSRIPFALAEDGYLPAPIARLHPKTGTPIVSITICAAICSIFILGPFQSLVVVDVTIYAFALLLEFAALWIMRLKYPHLERPFAIPGGKLGLVLVTLFPVLIISTAIYYQVLDVGIVQGIGWAVGGAATGPVAYVVLGAIFKRSSGTDRTYTVEQIERGEFEREVAG